jgi:threonylcarbamoyladenosine tRNA methylthiotransferase MtaB
MVGFPGETEQDFNQTYQLLAALPLAYFHVFPFSERKQTKSSSLPDKVPANIKEERSKILRDLSLVKRQTFLKSLLGTSRWVLFEEEKQGCWVGFTDNYMHVKVKTQQNLKNQLREINLVDTLEDYFIGEIV